MANDDCDFSKIVLTNGAHLVICSNVTVRTGAIEAYGTAGHSIAVAGGKLEIPDNYVFTNHLLRCFADGSTLSPKTEGSGLSLAKGVTLTCDRELTVPGDLTLLSGSTVTHTGANSSYTGHRVYIICTNLTVASGASINVNGVGFAAQSGDGKPVTTGKTDRGGSHGGLGADVGEAKCYGSITSPDTYGSGGSSRISCGTLGGAGKVSADGARSGCGGHGAGGRIAIRQTVATSFTENVTVRATCGWASAAGAVPYEQGCGTIYLRNAGDAPDAGTCIISQMDGHSEGRSGHPAAAELPATGGETGRDFRKTNFVVERGGTLRLTDDLTMNDLDLRANGCLRLKGHTLTIISHDHRDGRGWKGTVTYDGGKIVWRPNPLCIIIR